MPKKDSSVFTSAREPRFHDLHHEMALAVGYICWTIPVVVVFEVLPCALSSDGSFGIHEENGGRSPYENSH